MTSGWSLWQLVDSGFPTGGFAHSGGLEVAWQAGEISRDSDDLEQFLESALRQAVTGSFPYIRSAYRAPQQFERLDAHCDAFLSNRLANQASRAQGSGMLRSAKAAFPDAPFRQLRMAAQRGNWPCHLAVVHGVVARRLEIEHEEALQAFLFVTIRTLLASAIRLNIIGPLRSQALLAQFGPIAEKMLHSAGDLPETQAIQTAPVLDMMQAMHDRLYSRLFQS